MDPLFGQSASAAGKPKVEIERQRREEEGDYTEQSAEIRLVG